MKTQLPAMAALPPGKEDASPLARYLSEQLGNHNHLNVPYDHVPGIMHGAMAIAALHPFDPDEMVPYEDRKGNKVTSFSLLTSVLKLNNFNRPVATIRWPREMEGFGPHLARTTVHGAPAEIDPEWVAAALTAAGCNPWRKFNPKKAGLPTPVNLALSSGYGGLFDRFLDCPGAPAAQWVANASFGKPSDGVSVLQYACSREGGLSTVQALVDRGVRLPANKAVDVLCTATPKAVVLLAQAGLPEIAPADKAKIQAAWRDRSAQAQLTPDAVEKMQLAAWGDIDVNMSAGALSIKRLLGAEWGRNPGGSISQAYDFSVRDEVNLADRAMIKGGPQAGQWSVFAAAVASRIRQAGGTGALGWSTPIMLHREFDNEAKVWRVADCSQPPYRGSLECAIGFDWRPGISIDGVVALSLFGQRGPDTYASSELKAKTEKDLADDMEQFAHAANIDNIHQWARAAMPDAVQFTNKLLKSPKVNAARCFLFTWGAALTRQPGLVLDVAPQDALELLLALTSRFQLSIPWGAWKGSGLATEARAFDTVASVLFPSLTPDSFTQDPALQGTQRAAALVLALARGPNKGLKGLKGLETLAQMEAAVPHLSEAEFAIVSAWADSSPTTGASDAGAKAVIQRWRLNQSTEQAASTRRGPRL